jgi:hypothetical protein
MRAVRSISILPCLSIRQKNTVVLKGQTYLPVSSNGAADRTRDVIETVCWLYFGLLPVTFVAGGFAVLISDHSDAAVEIPCKGAGILPIWQRWLAVAALRLQNSADAVIAVPSTPE